MPRGRRGLSIVPPEEVQAAIRARWLAPAEVGRRFGVNERTVRRWRRTGLPLYYGKRWVTRDQWDSFKATGHPVELKKVSRRSTTRTSIGRPL